MRVHGYSVVISTLAGFCMEEGKCITNAMTGSSDWIEDVELSDPPLYKGRFTGL